MSKEDERYRKMVESSQDWFWEFDEHANFTYVSPAIKNILGYEPDDLIGRNAFALMDANEARRVHQHFDPIAKKYLPFTHLENINVHKDGHDVVIESSGTPIFDDAGNFRGYRGIDRDITERKQLQQKLTGSEEQYRPIFQNNPQPMWIYDLETLRYLAVNNAAVHHYGYTRDEFLQMTIKDIRPADDVAALMENVERVTQGLDIAGSWRHLKKDGSLIFVDITSHTLTFNNRPAELVMAQDITERKQAEKKLLETESRYRALFENMTAGFVLFEVIEDGNGVPVDLLIIAANKGFEKAIGLKAIDVAGKRLTEVMPGVENDAVDWIEIYGQIAINGEARQFEESSELLGRYYSIIAYQAGPGQCAVTFVDVSERKKAENERERLLQAIEQSAEIVMITDPDGVIDYVNPAFEAVTGYPRASVLGKTPRILKSGAQDEDFYRQMWQELNAGKTWRGRFVNKRKDGSLYHEDASISPVCDSTGEITNFIATKRDITEQLSVEQQFLQAQKMESIGQLAGGVAHDFNNMLSLIIGRAELGMRKLDPEDASYKTLHEIQNAANRSARLTQQLLAFARKQTVAPITLDLNSSIESMLQMLRQLIGENIELLWLPGNSLWPIEIDPSQLDQILSNLIINARDAIADIGKITIESSTATFDQSYCDRHPGFHPGEFSMLAVSDDGVGMDDQTVQRIFDPFYTTKGFGEGTGLGLSTVYGIVKQNNAFINVYSEPDRGTTIRIYFPRAVAAVDDLSPDENVAIQSGSGQTVLLVEDDTALLRLGEELLSELGYNVIAADSAADAIAFATEREGKIDLLITDVVMPEMNGRELAETLSVRLPRLKILYTSGYTANVIAHHNVLDEGVNFLQKPLSPQTLARKISQILN